jgi:excisionase family DNA binding protein
MNTAPEDDRLLLRITEAAALLGIGRSKMFELLASGEIPVIRLGRVVRVPREGLREWVRWRSSRPTEEAA